MTTVGTKAAMSSQGYGEFLYTPTGTPAYVESVFSPYIYTGTGVSNTIENNIALSANFTGGSAFFGSTSGYLIYTDTVNTFGTGDFTIEFFIYPTATAHNVLFNSVTTTNWAVITFGNNVYWQYNGGNVLNTTTTLTLNQWNHVAVVRSGTTLTIYINGTSGASATNATNYPAPTGTKRIGPSAGGSVPFYTSNLRIVKGVAVYTGTFTPPTSPLTTTQSANTNGNPSAAITGTATSLLICQSPSPFVDNSSNAFAITINGTTAQAPAAKNFGPFNTTVPANPTINGLVWIKDRTAANNHNLFDTTQKATKLLQSNTTGTTITDTASLLSFNANGFTLGTGNTTGSQVNTSTDSFASWTFLKQQKFFDIVTYTGTGSATTIPHNLGSVPGCIIVKRTDATVAWITYHSGLTNANYSVNLNATIAQVSNSSVWNGTAPTSSVFSVGTANSTNISGGTFVAYLFASNAGGFGSANNQNIITCGSFTTDASGVATVNLGYEPQWLLSKVISTTGNWAIYDTVRGFNQSTVLDLFPNLANAEANDTTVFATPTATGFTTTGFTASQTYIYIAIRRGPMATPTSGTSVFSPITANAVTGTVQTTNFLVDSLWEAKRASADTLNTALNDRLIGVGSGGSTNSVLSYLITSSTAAIGSANVTNYILTNTGFGIPSYYASASSIFWSFGRAPGFFDQVCYTGTGSATTFTHNLGVAPEFIIVKKRSAASTTGWISGATALGWGNKLYLNTTAASAADSTAWNSTAPTSTVFSVGTNTDSNNSGDTFIAYLFASLSNVSKVGTYSGTGATQTISCGFTGGARFVMIKRTDTTGAWYVWDTARGMVSGTDPSTLFNTTAAEVNANSVYTTTGGFQIVSTVAGINASGGTYLFLAIA